MTSPAVAPPVTHTIADAAARTGVTAHTLRYYERIGLLDVARDPNGRRRYDATDLARVTFLTRLRQSEMPIRDIARYVDLVREGDHTEPQRLAILQAHRDAVVHRIDELTQALPVVDFKITVYGGSTGSIHTLHTESDCT